jgi:hypothetical protein
MCPELLIRIRTYLEYISGARYHKECRTDPGLVITIALVNEQKLFKKIFPENPSTKRYGGDCEPDYETGKNKTMTDKRNTGNNMREFLLLTSSSTSISLSSSDILLWFHFLIWNPNSGTGV